MKLVIVPLALSALILSGCLDVLKSSAPNSNPNAWMPQDSGTTVATLSERPLQAGDVVAVRILTIGTAEIPPTQDVVDSFGNISLYLLGEFKVSGFTTAEAEKEVYNSYIKKGIFAEKSITVQITSQTIVDEFAKTVSVTGAVIKRGPLQYFNGLTLLEAIIRAGDLDKFANGTVYITRNGNRTKYNLYKIKKGNQEDPLLQPRDIIEAEERSF